jgi:hypothetical protein
MSCRMAALAMAFSLAVLPACVAQDCCGDNVQVVLSGTDRYANEMSWVIDGVGPATTSTRRTRRRRSRYVWTDASSSETFSNGDGTFGAYDIGQQPTHTLTFSDEVRVEASRLLLSLSLTQLLTILFAEISVVLRRVW